METEPQVIVKTKQAMILGYLSKMKGTKRTTALQSPPLIDICISWLGAFLGIGTVAYLSLIYKMPLLVPSFGASAVLIYGSPDVPFAQPRNVFFGHTISAIVGVSVYALFGLSWWSAAVATALAIAIMLLTKTTHPPAGATALIAVLTKATPKYILTPVGLGAVWLIAIGLLINNLSPNRKYPKYWL